MFRTALLTTALLLTSFSPSTSAALGLRGAPNLINFCEEMGRSPLHCYETLIFDTGELFNDSDEEEVVFAQDVSASPWPHILVQLSVESIIPKGMKVRISEPGTGRVTHEMFMSLLRPSLRNDVFEHFRNPTPWVIHGDEFRLEFIAPPRSSARLIIEKIYLPTHATFEVSTSEIHSKDICGLGDDRQPHSDPAVARLLYGQLNRCSGFIADCSTGPDKCFVSAGHCLIGPIIFADRAEFNVPESDLNTCATNHPSADSTYAIDRTALVAINDTDADNNDRDWAVMRLVPNALTGNTAFDQQGASVALRSASLPALGSTLRLAGYGEDRTDDALDDACGSCLLNNGTGRRNRTQQIGSGAFLGFTPKQIAYDIDTCNGSSGSPVTYVGQVVGVHTGNLCAQVGVNAGTNIQRPELSRALGDAFSVKDSNVAVDLDAAMNATGDGVVVWEDNLNGRVKFRRLTPSLTLGPEEQFSNLSAPFPAPKVDIAPTGVFVVVYDAWNGLSGQVHNADGSVFASPFLLGLPALPRSHDVALSGGGFSAIGMVEKGISGTFLQIRRFSFLGTPSADAEDVAEVSDPGNTTTSIQSNDSGTSLVMWRVSNSDVQARVYSSSGSPRPVFSISASSAELLDDGTIIAPSIIEEPGFGEDRIVGQKYSLNGTPMGQPIDLLVTSLNYFPGIIGSDPRIVSMHSYGFFLTWARAQDTLMAQQFYLNGTAIADPFDLNPGLDSDGDEYVRAARTAGLFVTCRSGRAQFALKSSDAAVIESFNIFADGFESGDSLAWSSTVGAGTS